MTNVLQTMTNLPFVEILQIGAIGLGFLLALLAFLLLGREQKKKEPHPKILRQINIFMGFSVTLCVIGVVPEILQRIDFADSSALGQLQSENTKLEDNRARLEKELKSASAKLISAKGRLSKVCVHIRTTNWLDNSSEARKSLSKDCK